MLNDNIKNLILGTIDLYGNSNLNQAIIDEGFQKLKQAKELLTIDNDNPIETFDEEEIPYICINYYSPKMEDTKDVIIPFYATDFYQKEYAQDDYSEEFKLRYELDGKVSYKNIKIVELQEQANLKLDEVKAIVAELKGLIANA